MNESQKNISSLTTPMAFREALMKVLEQTDVKLSDHAHRRRLELYLESLWHVASQHKDKTVLSYELMLEWIKQAFNYPPMPYDWETELRKHYDAEMDVEYSDREKYSTFERQIESQIYNFKRMNRGLPVHQSLTWENPSVESFWERATATMEEDDEPLESPLTWADFNYMLICGQFTE